MPGKIQSQIFSPQVEVAFGGGINISYFDIGGGTPGVTLWNTLLYQWDEHWKAGYRIGFYNVVGTDEGTDYFGRGLAYDSYLYELSGRVEYLFFFSSSWKSIWKQKINPMLPYGGTWKRKIKPFLYAGGGILHHRPFVYLYPTGDGLDENPDYASIKTSLNAGFGVYYYLNRFVAIAFEAGSNFPFFNYIEGFEQEEFPDKMDMFHTFGVRVIWSHSSGAKKFGGRKYR
jgi:hypothetical protein